MDNIQLVVTDIDGTIMPEGARELHPQYFDLIVQLKEAGIQVVIASGRQTESIERLFAPVLDHISLIGNGGLSVKTPTYSRILQTIPREWVLELEHDIAQLDSVDSLFCGLNMSYAHDANCEMVRRLVDEYRVNVTITGGVGNLPDVPLGKISLFREHALEEQVMQSFFPKWAERLSLTMAGDYWLDCVMPDVNKAQALQIILEELSIPASAVLASGDQMNDIAMLQLAGQSIAVSNARPELQAIATEVHCNDDFLAVARAWEALLG